MRFIKKHPLLIIFILGLLLRFSLVFLDFSWDVNNHMTWAKDLVNRGFVNFYDKISSNVFASAYPNYPPLANFIFYFTYPLQSIIHKIAWFINVTIPPFPSKLIFFIETRTFFAATFKVPAIVADLGIAWLCYLFAKKIVPNNKKLHLLAPILILFNPAVFQNSSYWGQIDAIPIFFILLSTYLLLFSKKYLLSGILFTLALLVKPTAFVYLPVYLFFFIKKFGFLNLIKTFLVGNLIFLISFLPFLTNINDFFAPYKIYAEKIMAAQSLPYVTNGAFNFWVLVTGFNGIKDTAPFILGLSYRLWGYLIVGVIFAITIYYFSKEKDKISSFFYITFLVSFACFLFLTKMHERYSLLPLPFLLIASLKNKQLFRWFIVLSIISYLNLYHSWPVPNLAPLMEAFSIIYVSVLIAFANLLIFFYLLWQFKKYGTMKLEVKKRKAVKSSVSLVKL